MQEKKFDLTSGSILQKLLLVAVPIMGTQLLQMFYNLTDMFWLGRVGADAVAASGTAGMYLWLSQGLMMLGRMGSEIGVAQHLGRKDEATARRYAQSSLVLAILLGIAFGGSMALFRRPLVGFFGIADQNVVADTELYLAITAIGIPFTYITAAIVGTFNASGNSRTPFLINGIGLVVNMVLDPLLIFNLGMGITGAAWATVLAQVLVALAFLWAVTLSKARPLGAMRLFCKLKWAEVCTILRWCVPICLEGLLFTLLSMVIGRFVAAFGTEAIAVQRVGGQIESLSWLIGGGFASAVTAFFGQNYGAGKWGRIRKGYSIALRTMLVWGGLVTLLLWFGGSALFRLFLPEDGLVSMGKDYVQILALCQLIACLEYTAAGAFRGLGKTLPPSIVSISGNLLRIPLVWWLSTTPLGLNGIWWGITIGAILRGLVTFTWYHFSAKHLPTEDTPPKSTC